MNSFYGGQQGKNFQIKKIFTTVYENNNTTLKTQVLPAMKEKTLRVKLPEIAKKIPNKDKINLSEVASRVQPDLVQITDIIKIQEAATKILDILGVMLTDELIQNIVDDILQEDEINFENLTEQSSEAIIDSMFARVKSHCIGTVQQDEELLLGYSQEDIEQVQNDLSLIFDKILYFEKNLLDAEIRALIADVSIILEDYADDLIKNNESLLGDLKKRWYSDIGVGEIVIVSYGMPHDIEYDIYKNIDLKYQHKSINGTNIIVEDNNKTYNSTLWQKVYIDEGQNIGKHDLLVEDATYGLAYRLLSSMTGNTPSFNFQTHIVDNDEEPWVEVDSTNVDYPILHMYLPKNLTVGKISTEFLNVGTLKETVHEDGSITKDYVNTEPFVAPYISGDKDELLNFVFGLPKTQILRQGITNLLTPAAPPYFNIDYSDINNPVIDFYLPQTQRLNTEVIVEWLDPNQKPQVSLSEENILHPQFAFKLPEAMKFFYGVGILGKSSAINYVVTKEELEAAGLYESFIEIDDVGNIKVKANTGDHYIDKITGFIYYITKVNTQIEFIDDISEENLISLEFEFKACLNGPDPSIRTEVISPYEKKGDEFIQQMPSVEAEYEDPKEQLGLTHVFKLPKLPHMITSYTELGPNDSGNVELNIKSEDTVDFHFSVPSGVNWFIGTEVTPLTISTGNFISNGEKIAKKGDFYLYINPNNEKDTLQGRIFVYQGDKIDAVTGERAPGSWEDTGRSIEGPVGPSLNIVWKSDFIEDDNFTFSDIGTALEIQMGRKPDKDELVAVNFTNKENETKSYWFYIVNGQWSSVILTGSIADSLDGSYRPDSDQMNGRVYDTFYINSLIVNEKIETANAEGEEDYLNAAPPYKTYSANYLNYKFKDIDEHLNISLRLLSVESKASKLSEDANEVYKNAVINSEAVNTLANCLTWGTFGELLEPTLAPSINDLILGLGIDKSLLEMENLVNAIAEVSEEIGDLNAGARLDALEENIETLTTQYEMLSAQIEQQSVIVNKLMENVIWGNINDLIPPPTEPETPNLEEPGDGEVTEEENE